MMDFDTCVHVLSRSLTLGLLYASALWCCANFVVCQDDSDIGGEGEFEDDDDLVGISR